MQVVLPASMCAQIPIFLYLSRGTMRLPAQQCSSHLYLQLERRGMTILDMGHMPQSFLQAGRQPSCQVEAAGLQVWGLMQWLHY